MIMCVCLLLASGFPSLLVEGKGGEINPSNITFVTLTPETRIINTISGYVFNTARRPIDQLRVELLNEVDSVIATTRTDGSGRYVFSGITSGSFQIRALTHGTNYISQTERVVVSSLGSEYIQVDFTLRSKKITGGDAGVMLSSTVFAQEVPEAAQRIYDKAVKNLASEKNKEQGISELKMAISIFPRYYLALELLGTEYVKLRNFAQAQEVLTQAIQINPQGQTSLYSLGIARYYLQQLPASVDALRRCVRVSPSSINANLWLGIVLFKSKDYSESEASLKRAVALGSGRIPDAHMYLAQIYSNDKRYKEAAKELEIYLQEAPDARDAMAIRKIIAQLKAK